MEPSTTKLIDRWFPCTAVDEAVRTASGSGQREKAIFTWFASRPVAQARAAVLTAILPNDPALPPLVDAAVRRGDREALDHLERVIADNYPAGRPVVLDVFSGRAIIPLEAARLGATAVGIDLSPVATVGGRLLADFPSRDWGAEPALPFAAVEGGDADPEDDEQMTLDTGDQPRLVTDLAIFLKEAGSRMASAVEPYYPRNPDGSFPWGYIWAVSVPCDGCRRRFPLVGSLTLRHPYRRTSDAGQSFHIQTSGDRWYVEVVDGTPQQMPTLRAAAGKKGKSAHCPFCRHVHSLEAVKAKGLARQYRDELLVVADTFGDTRKVFRVPRQEEIDAAQSVDLSGLPKVGGLTAVPDEPIPAGNVHTVRASGYGYADFGSLMVERQALQFSELVRAIRACRDDMLAAGNSEEYAHALAAYATAALVRRLRRATRGARLEGRGGPAGDGQNRVYVGDIFSDESKISFNFDCLETGPGTGAGSWASVAASEVKALAEMMKVSPRKSARLRQGSAMALPFRDGTVDAVVTDPPYYNMIDYADVSDLFFVWMKRALIDADPGMFEGHRLQDKSDEIIVKNGGTETEHRTREFYEASLAKAFAEARRVLRPDGHLVVVFGHSDPEAWKRLLGALHRAGFVVTSSWPSRTESANTGVASIKVTVSIGCRVAAPARPVATAAQVDREVTEAVHGRVRQWGVDGLALSDQMMAAYGPAMEVYGRYDQILLPDGNPAPLERYLVLARTAAREAMHLKLDQIPLETFDAITRFAVFWMRAYGRTNVPKGEALFAAQSESLRFDDVRQTLLAESKAGFKLLLASPAEVDSATPVFNVVRAMADAWAREGSEGVAATLVRAERAPDDQHVWAVVGDLVAELPASDPVAKALTAVQRNRSAIQTLTGGLAQRRTGGAEQQALELSEA